MRYGYFDEANKEYVIERPDTPTPWINYLGTLDYGSIISNNGGGYSFSKSSARGRILRGRFNAIPFNQPGRWVYIRDNESGDFWSSTWQPVGKKLDSYKTECRHGTAYTTITSLYDSIQSATTWYVPREADYEVMRFTVKNTGTKPRDLSLFNYVELTNDENEGQDLDNLQYSLYISSSDMRDNCIEQTINPYQSEDRTKGGLDGESDAKGGPRRRFVALCGAEAAGWEGSRERFIGEYRTYANPVAVETGEVSNGGNFIKNTTGTFKIDARLEPGAEKSFVIVLGYGGRERGTALQTRYADTATVDAELDELKSYWHSRLDRFVVKTPDENFDAMVNTWNAYQCFVNLFWSRAASMVYVSLRDGFGYRDTVVDIQGVIHMDPELAGRQLRFMLSGQVSTGGGLPLVTVDLQPGHEHPPESAEYAKKTGYHDYRCDDHLWLFQTVPMYINETGQTEFLDEVIPYADTGEATVYEHLKKALEFSLGRLGTHGLVQGLKADWNDCLRMGRTGESVFASMQLYMGFQQFAEYADLKQRPEDSAWAKEQARILAENLNTHAWEQDRFVRGFSTVDGYTVGSKENEEGSLWLNPQAWSVISGFDRDTRAKKALDNVEQQLATDYGCMLMYPALRTYGFPVARMILFPAGVKENAGIFSQAQGWIIFAEALMGHGNRAYSYYQRVNPASLNEQAELRETEPYAHSQFTEGVDSPHHGRSHNSWLTGTASTMMVAAVHGILGIRPVADGLKIDPSIPSTWDTFSIKRAFRGKKLDIQVNNPDGVEHGVVKTVINGETIEGGGVIPFARMKETNAVEVTMGKV